MFIAVAAEGTLDQAIATRIAVECGFAIAEVYGGNGKADLLRKIRGYNASAMRRAWFVVVDLDGAACAADARAGWLPDCSTFMCFRIAVREIESWILADVERIASALGVARQWVPDAPEALDDPKRAMIDLARRSRRRDVRQDMVPAPGSGRSVGPGYTSKLISFVEDAQHGWRPQMAAARAQSLSRAMNCLNALRAGYRWVGDG